MAATLPLPTITNPPDQVGPIGAQLCSPFLVNAYNFGANLLLAGDFETSVGIGASSVAGPGWTTAYTPSGDIFSAGQDTYALFTTNGGQVTGGNVDAALIPAIGAKSFLFNVGVNTAVPILSWANIPLVNGKRYVLTAMAASVYFPYSLAIQIDGVVQVAMTAPLVERVWTLTQTEFTWTGTTGNHTVTINTNTNVGDGNDHALDDIGMFEGDPITPVSSDPACTVNLVSVDNAGYHYEICCTPTSTAPVTRTVSVTDGLNNTASQDVIFTGTVAANCTGATGITGTSANLNGTIAGIPVGGSARFRRGVAPGVYTVNAPASPYVDGPVSAPASGLALSAPYYYVLEILDNTNTVVATSAECSFTTTAIEPGSSACPPPPNVSNCPPITTYSVGGTEYLALLMCDANGNQVITVWQLCDGIVSGAPSYYTLGGVAITPALPVRDCSSGFDFEQIVFCDTGTIPSTPFISRVRWDENGNLIPEATGTFALDGVTPYSPLGAVVLCDSGALPPQAFCFKSSVTAPQDFPGRSFSGILQIARGFRVASVIVGAITYPIGITWSVLDETGAPFMAALAAALQSKIPGSSVTMVPVSPVDPCAVTPQSFQIDVACINATKAPINIDIVYDGGSDLIQNAGFEESPLNNTFHQAMRQDAGGFIRCTNIANRGWETNDPLQQFEIWPPGFLGATPTPRGTGIQEVNANGTDTIWQTMVVPVAANYTLRATVGGRQVTEQFPIKLSTGDTGATGPGDLINAVITAPAVAQTANPAPWTNFTQNIFLAAGTYTLSLKGPSTTPSIGGLFTDLRLFTTEAGKIQSLTASETCTVSEDVTTTTNDCQIWQPLLGAGGAIISWVNPRTGVTLTNAAFWSQVPAPTCCTSDPAGGTEITAPNLEDSYLVCGTVAGIQVPLIRQVIMDQNGGAISETFITVDGVPVTPTTWTPGDCERGFQTEILCDDNGPFLRRYVRDAEGNVTSLDLTLDGSSVYVTVGTPKVCGASSLVIGEMCYGPATLTMALTPVTVVGADEGPQVVTFNNGSGVTATITTALGQANTYNVPVLGTALPNTAVNAPTTIDLGTCRTGVIINFSAFDNPSTGANERLRNISPAPSRITGEGVLVGSNGVDSTTGPGPGKNFQLYWDQGVRSISFDFLSAGHAVESIVFVNSLTIDNLAKVAAVLCDGCDGGIKYYDTLTGAEVVAPVLRECPEGCASGVASGNTLIRACDTVTGTGTPATCATGTPISFIAPDAQDAEQKNPTTGGNAVNVNDNDLECSGTGEVGETDYMIAVRFNAPIPQGATVCSAYVQFTAESNTSFGVIDIAIDGEDVDSSAPFTTAANSVVPRVRTTALVNWNNVPIWTNNAAGVNQQTPSLVSVVQEIVNRAGWVSGNPLALFFTPGATGYRRASSIQDGSKAPQFHVTYVTGAGVTETTCTPFYVEVDSDNAPTGNNFFIDPADETWKPYTPVGDVTIGDCQCGDPSSSIDYEAFCYEDSLGIKFTRVFRVTANGPTLVGDYAPDFSGVYAPVGAYAACPAVAHEGEPLVLCDDNGPFLRHIIYSNEGLLDAPYDTLIDGQTPYTTVGTVKVCASTITDLEAVDFCLKANTAGAGYAAGDQIKLTRWFNPATNTQVSEVAFNMTQGGSAVTVPLTAANFDACAESTVVVEEGCLQTTVSPTLIAPTFFTPFPDPSAGTTNPSWARSADAGITYVANPADSAAEVVGPRGQVRFRQVITIPAMYSGTFAVTVSGDIFNGASNDPAEVFYDGVTQGTIIPLAGPVTKVLPVVPGVHYFDIWIGASGSAGLTAPVVTVSYTNVTEILPGTATSIEIVKTISPTGVITVKYHDAAGVEIIPPVGSTISVGRCLKASSTEILCDSVGSFLRRYGEEAGDYTLDGLTRYTPVGAVDVCKCSEIQPTIDSTLQSLVGATTVTIPIGARSVSLAVVTGTVSVVIGAAAAVVVPAGSSFTWSVNEGGPAGETLAKAHVFTGIVGTTAFVTTTREI